MISYAQMNAYYVTKKIQLEMGSTSHNMSTKPPIGIEQDESSSKHGFFFLLHNKELIELEVA
jgi:hypothetical protein